MQLCQQVESIYVLINTTNNNDSPVKIEMDISYVHHQLLTQKISRGRQVYRYSSDALINKQQLCDHQMPGQKLKYEKINQVFRRECLVLEKEQSEDFLMQLCQQVESIYVLINTTNNNDSLVKIEMDISYECLVLEKEQSEDSLMQLCQQVESMYVLMNTTNNNDSPVKIEMDISYVHHQCII
ncbi:unnamed protein product [Rotaria sordida]|uniref:Uncharacterized protein n=3 Tax=Rotaria sordida TaxID=392033 RepID=A0A814C394_9BILA|nr:unnamed protein product [Rotaria sordida]